MSMKLNFADRLLAMGRRYQDQGRDRDARRILDKLASFGALPVEVAEETQARLGAIHLRRRKLRPAQRHFTAALLHNPESARYHYLLATSIDTRERADAERALEHFRKSLALDPDQPRCLSEQGLLAARLGNTEDGIAAMRRAADMAPADAEVLGNLIDTLRSLGEIAEARALLRASRFRNPRNPQFQKLHGDFELKQLRRQQRAALRGDVSRRSEEDQPTFLPFAPVPDEGPTEPRSRKASRHDLPTPLPRPHFPRQHRQHDQKRAQ